MNKASNAALKQPEPTATKGVDLTKAPAAGSPAPTPGTDGDKAPATPAAPETPKPDPFAKLPRVKLGETTDVVDLSGVETSLPRKYEKVNAEAIAGKFPIQKDWKHAEAIFIPGVNKGGENGFRAGSVYGTIAAIAHKAGRSGITAHELVTEVRKQQIGNKRSHYCDKLPPVGWAEGWINTAVNKRYVGVHASRKAPRIFPEAAKNTEASPAENAAAAAGKTKGNTEGDKAKS